VEEFVWETIREKKRMRELLALGKSDGIGKEREEDGEGRERGLRSQVQVGECL
jgi:hypothetical protein